MVHPPASSYPSTGGPSGLSSSSSPSSATHTSPNPNESKRTSYLKRSWNLRSRLSSSNAPSDLADDDVDDAIWDKNDAAFFAESAARQHSSSSNGSSRNQHPYAASSSDTDFHPYHSSSLRFSASHLSSFTSSDASPRPSSHASNQPAATPPTYAYDPSDPRRSSKVTPPPSMRPLSKGSATSWTSPSTARSNRSSPLLFDSAAFGDLSAASSSSYSASWSSPSSSAVLPHPIRHDSGTDWGHQKRTSGSARIWLARTSAGSYSSSPPSLRSSVAWDPASPGSATINVPSAGIEQSPPAPTAPRMSALAEAPMASMLSMTSSLSSVSSMSPRMLSSPRQTPGLSTSPPAPSHHFEGQKSMLEISPVPDDGEDSACPLSNPAALGPSRRSSGLLDDFADDGDQRRQASFELQGESSHAPADEDWAFEQPSSIRTLQPPRPQAGDFLPPRRTIRYTSSQTRLNAANAAAASSANSPIWTADQDDDGGAESLHEYSDADDDLYEDALDGDATLTADHGGDAMADGVDPRNFTQEGHAYHGEALHQPLQSRDGSHSSHHTSSHQRGPSAGGRKDLTSFLGARFTNPTTQGKGLRHGVSMDSLRGSATVGTASGVGTSTPKKKERGLLRGIHSRDSSHSAAGLLAFPERALQRSEQAPASSPSSPKLISGLKKLIKKDKTAAHPSRRSRDLAEQTGQVHGPGSTLNAPFHADAATRGTPWGGREKAVFVSDDVQIVSAANDWATDGYAAERRSNSDAHSGQFHVRSSGDSISRANSQQGAVADPQGPRWSAEVGSPGSIGSHSVRYSGNSSLAASHLQTDRRPSSSSQLRSPLLRSPAALSGRPSSSTSSDARGMDHRTQTSAMNTLQARRPSTAAAALPHPASQRSSREDEEEGEGSVHGTHNQRTHNAASSGRTRVNSSSGFSVMGLIRRTPSSDSLGPASVRSAFNASAALPRKSRRDSTASYGSHASRASRASVIEHISHDDARRQSGLGGRSGPVILPPSSAPPVTVRPDGRSRSGSLNSVAWSMGNKDEDEPRTWRGAPPGFPAAPNPGPAPARPARPGTATATMQSGAGGSSQGHGDDANQLRGRTSSMHSQPGSIGLAAFPSSVAPSIASSRASSAAHSTSHSHSHSFSQLGSLNNGSTTSAARNASRSSASFLSPASSLLMNNFNESHSARWTNLQREFDLTKPRASADAKSGRGKASSSTASTSPLPLRAMAWPWPGRRGAPAAETSSQAGNIGTSTFDSQGSSLYSFPRSPSLRSTGTAGMYGAGVASNASMSGSIGTSGGHEGHRHQQQQQQVGQDSTGTTSQPGSAAKDSPGPGIRKRWSSVFGALGGDVTRRSRERSRDAVRSALTAGSRRAGSRGPRDISRPVSAAGSIFSDESDGTTGGSIFEVDADGATGPPPNSDFDGDADARESLEVDAEQSLPGNSSWALHARVRTAPSHVSTFGFAEMGGAGPRSRELRPRVDQPMAGFKPATVNGSERGQDANITGDLRSLHGRAADKQQASTVPPATSVPPTATSASTRPVDPSTTAAQSIAARIPQRKASLSSHSRPHIPLHHQTPSSAPVDDSYDRRAASVQDQYRDPEASMLPQGDTPSPDARRLRRPTFGLEMQPDAAAAFDCIPSPQISYGVGAGEQRTTAQPRQTREPQSAPPGADMSSSGHSMDALSSRNGYGFRTDARRDEELLSDSGHSGQSGESGRIDIVYPRSRSSSASASASACTSTSRLASTGEAEMLRTRHDAGDSVGHGSRRDSVRSTWSRSTSQGASTMLQEAASDSSGHGQVAPPSTHPARSLRRPNPLRLDPALAASEQSRGPSPFSQSDFQHAWTGIAPRPPPLDAPSSPCTPCTPGIPGPNAQGPMLAVGPGLMFSRMSLGPSGKAEKGEAAAALPPSTGIPAVTGEGSPLVTRTSASPPDGHRHAHQISLSSLGGFLDTDEEGEDVKHANEPRGADRGINDASGGCFILMGDPDSESDAGESEAGSEA